MLSDTDLQTVLPDLKTTSLTGYLYRALDDDYLTTVNSLIGSRRANGRYHHRDDQLGTLYLAEDEMGAAAELRQRRRSMLPPAPFQQDRAHGTYTAPFLVSLTRLIDLRQLEIQQALGTNPMELTGSWKLQNEHQQRAETQRLGFAALNAGVEGLIYTSATEYRGNNVVLFSRNLPSQMQASLPSIFPEQAVQHVGDLEKN
jgi:RES domain-containing protein